MYRALSDFDGDFAPEFGTEDAPATFKPIFKAIGLKLELRAQ